MSTHLGIGPLGICACKSSNDLCGVSEAEFRREVCRQARAYERMPSLKWGRPWVCQRCIASLAKRDREFRRKARRQLERTAIYYGRAGKITQLNWPHYDAARAIAREEGRAR